MFFNGTRFSLLPKLALKLNSSGPMKNFLYFNNPYACLKNSRMDADQAVKEIFYTFLYFRMNTDLVYLENISNQHF